MVGIGMSKPYRDPLSPEPANPYNHTAGMLEPKSDKERVATWIMEQGYATGHGDTVEDMLHELVPQVEDKIRREFEPVRRACKLFEEASNAWMDRALKAEAAITDFDKLAEKRLGQT